jgi:hypothetical protein
VQYLSIK